MNAADGEYRVSECVFQGDNRDGDFIVTILGESLKGGKVDEGKLLENDPFKMLEQPFAGEK